ncbi:hypothetical protein BFG52_01675 [Acinetobacter larvae]|uniref:Uncharacterized protein n=1 Tax=Acinetobacter larvae TaxID=1789224 RepID=A0A1B2LW54_9GAMM|nr:hypothetical protein BFG52_01675 [Acinetobacter larvae]
MLGDIAYGASSCFASIRYIYRELKNISVSNEAYATLNLSGQPTDTEMIALLKHSIRQYHSTKIG